MQTTSIPYIAKKDDNLTKIVQNSIDAFRNVVGPQGVYKGMKNYREFDSSVTPVVNVDGQDVNLNLDMDGQPVRIKLIIDGSPQSSWGYDKEIGALVFYNIPLKKIDGLKKSYWKDNHRYN